MSGTDAIIITRPCAAGCASLGDFVVVNDRWMSMPSGWFELLGCGPNEIRRFVCSRSCLLRVEAR